MNIIDESQAIDVLESCKVVKVFADMSSQVVEEDIQVEHELSIYVDDVLVDSQLCTPTNVVEFAIGHLYTQGIISSIDEVDSIEIDEEASEAQIVLVKTERLHRETFDQVVPIPWSAEDVFKLARVFKKGSPMHKSTKGAHSCYLAKGGEILFCYEDLGRHNAFDKVIGKAILEGIDLTQCTIFTSGRIPTDMLFKAVRSGVPILVSKAVPTNITVELAKQFRLTLICSAHDDSVNVINDPLGCLK